MLLSDEMLVEVVLIAVVVLAASYAWLRERYRYFEKIGVEYVEPVLIFGNMKNAALKKQNVLDLIEELYKNTKSG